MEEKGLDRDTMGIHKGKSSEALSHEAPKQKMKTKHTEPNSRFQKQKQKNCQCSILKPESASWKFVKQPCKLLPHFLLFRCSRSWNSIDGTRSLLLLEKELLTSSSTSSPTLLSQSWSKCFKLQDFLSNSLLVILPIPKFVSKKTCVTSSPPTTKFMNIHFLLSSSLLVQDNVVKIHSLGKNIHIQTLLLLQFSWPKYFPMQKIMKLNLKNGIL